MKKVLISIVCLAVLIALYACSNSGNDDLKDLDTVYFERVNPDALGDVADKIDRAKTEAGYELFRSGNNDYIVVYAGERPTADYTVEIISIAVEEGKTIVTVKETSPAEGDITAQVITYPYDVARLGSAISGKVEIEFVEGNAE